jgi:hypothetical protein
MAVRRLNIATIKEERISSARHYTETAKFTTINTDRSKAGDLNV